MGIGADLRDTFGFGRYIRERILPLAPPREPIPFRGFLEEGEEPLTFFEDLEADLLARPGAVWSVTGPPGFGKTLLGRWAAARWGRRFLDDPEATPVPVWIGPPEEDVGAESKPHLLEWVRIAREHKLPLVLILDAAGPAPRRQPAWSKGRSEIRVFQLSIEKGSLGRQVRLAPWDRETSLIAAHRARGEEGIRRIEALLGSPASPLATYPLFVSRILERDPAPLDELGRDGGVGEFLRWVHGLPGGPPVDFLRWCEALACSPDSSPALARKARMLHSRIAPGHDPSYHAVFLAHILGELVRGRREKKALRVRVFEEEEVKLLGKVLGGVAAGIASATSRDRTVASNRVNIHWHLRRTPLPPKLLRRASEVRIPGYRFDDGMDRLDLSRSDLDGISFGRREIARSKFTDCTFREADLLGLEVSSTAFRDCRFDLADLSGSRFKNCTFDECDLTQAVLGGASFARAFLDEVKFGPSLEGQPVQFDGSTLWTCDIGGLAARGLYLHDCEVMGVSLAGLAPGDIQAGKARFRRCDLSGLSATGASLPGSTFTDCRLADAVLEGADLQGAKLIRVEFQPGPASRAGLTEGSTRFHPMYGSQTGFYADDSELAVQGDPELVRTANLRGADLRGATFDHTDLFRVDLREAKLDPPLRDLAARMGAFLD